MTSDEARDAAFKVFNDAWNHAVVWADVPAKPPVADEPWARVTMIHADTSFSTINGEVGCRRFTSTGLISVQLFSPIGQGLTQSYQLAQDVMYAYQDARLPIWFRNYRMRPSEADGNFMRTNVLIDFEYDTVR